MDCILAGGTYTRNERGKTVTYKKGEPIRVTQDEILAFPNKFTPVIEPRDEEHEAALAREVETLTSQVATLTAERDELKKAPGAGEVTKLKADLAKAKKEADDLDAARLEAVEEMTRLKADNNTLSQQLDEALKPPKDAELKTNPAESSKTAKGTAKSE